MKSLTCEMCGSTDLMKQDGVFVCQSCGMKYSVEDAKKMMIEGTVDVQGTVKVDNSAFVEKYLANARRAKEKEDWEEVEKYYNMVEQNDPNNIEAIFYSAYGKAKTSLTSDDIYKRQAVFKVLTNCISILDDKYDVKNAEENKAAIISIAADLGAMICSNFVYTEWKNEYGSVTRTNKDETIALFGGLLDAFKETIYNIEQVDDQPYLHEAAINLYTVAKHARYWSLSLLNNWISQEQSRLNTCVAKIAAEESKDLSKKDIFEKAYDALSRNENMAFGYFNEYIKKDTNSPIGYLGKAICLTVDNKEVEAVAQIETASKFTASPDEKDMVDRLINYQAGPYNATLLLYAAANLSFTAAKFLVALGADVNIHASNNATALWYVCYKKLPEGKETEGRRIAQLLLSKGADVNVTNTDGVALFNGHTDSDISNMLLDKYPDLQRGTTIVPAKGGCYVATAVYGSYDCPQVWTLRRFRDDTLAETWYGRAFIHLYYAVSPTLVKWFGSTAWFKNMWKPKLDRLVENLQSEGVESTPYEDRIW